MGDDGNVPHSTNRVRNPKNILFQKRLFSVVYRQFLGSSPSTAFSVGIDLLIDPTFLCDSFSEKLKFE